MERAERDAAEMAQRGLGQRGASHGAIKMRRSGVQEGKREKEWRAWGCGEHGGGSGGVRMLCGWEREKRTGRWSRE